MKFFNRLYDCSSSLLLFRFQWQNVLYSTNKCSETFSCSLRKSWAFSLIYDAIFIISVFLSIYHRGWSFFEILYIKVFFFFHWVLIFFHSSVIVLTETNTYAVSINFKAILKWTFLLDSSNIPLHVFVTLNWDIAGYATITSKLFPCIQQRTEQRRVIFLPLHVEMCSIITHEWHLISHSLMAWHWEHTGDPGRGASSYICIFLVQVLWDIRIKVDWKLKWREVLHGWHRKTSFFI